MYPVAAALTVLLATSSEGAASATNEQLQAQAADLVSRCIDAGGAEGFGVPGATVSTPPPNVDIPLGAKVTFWRVPTQRGQLFAYSGFEGRTNFCGIVASGAGVTALANQMSQLLASRDGWVAASTKESVWLRPKPQSERYWGDRLNTSLHGAVVAIAERAGSAPQLQVHYHATGVI
jgi:hypothetical protein